MRIRELKDEECMDRDLWRRKIMSLGLRKLCIHGKTHKIKKYAAIVFYKHFFYIPAIRVLWQCNTSHT
jgi:hypothetical protein